MLKCVAEKQKRSSNSYHITGARKVIVEQTLQSHPANRSVLIVPEAVIVHGEEITGQRIICDLHLHAVINSTTKRETKDIYIKYALLLMQTNGKKCK